jgi:predicted kinase
MSELVLIRGLPGSGKSTLAHVFAAYGHKHFEADMWFERRGHDFQPFLLTHAHKWCEREARAALEAGKPVVVSNTFTRLWEMDNYIDMAFELGVPVRIVTATGKFKSVHGVPAEKIAQMAERWEPWPDGPVTAWGEEEAGDRGSPLPALEG